MRSIYIVALALILPLAASPAHATDAPSSQAQDTKVRCEKLGYAEGSEEYVNCVYVLSNLDKADKLLQVKSFTKCFDGVFYATRCVFWYSHQGARETVDETAVEAFNSMMDEEAVIRAKAEDYCREKHGEKADLSECMAAESEELYEGMSIKSKEFYEAFSAESSELYKRWADKSKELYKRLSVKGKELYKKSEKLWADWQLYEEIKNLWPD
jgi:hypothetical protein